MKDFKKYTEEKGHGETLPPMAAEITREETESAAELARKALAEYNGKSDVAVLNDILRRAEAEKRAGKLTNEQIDAFYAQFSPLFTPAQQKKLLSVTERLKKI